MFLCFVVFIFLYTWYVWEGILWWKYRSWDIDGLTRFELPEHEMWFSEFCLFARMCTSLAPERFGGFYSYSVFNSSLTGRVYIHLKSPSFNLARRGIIECLAVSLSIIGPPSGSIFELLRELGSGGLVAHVSTRDDIKANAFLCPFKTYSVVLAGISLTS